MKSLVFGVVVFFCLCAASGCGEASRNSITIGAAISLQPVLDSAIVWYGALEPDESILVSYAGSGTIRHQVTFGAPIDLFLSAASDHIDSLESEGAVLPSTRTVICVNSLVFIMSVRRAPVSSMEDMRLPGVAKIAIGEPDIVPAGRYAVQTIERLGLMGDVQDKLVYTRDVQQVLIHVRSGSVDAGFVYASDVLTADPVRVIQTVPDSLHDPIVYEGIVTSRSRHAEAAGRFLAYLTSDAVQQRFASLGFRSPHE